MCEPLTIAAMTAMAASGGMQAYSQYQQGSAASRYSNRMAEQSRIEGELALQAGKKQSELVQDAAKVEGKRHKVMVGDLESAQRAALVKSGIDLSSVTAEDIAGDSMSKAKLDELMLRFNADSKSWAIMQDAKYRKWGAEEQAKQHEYSGKVAKKAGQMGMFSTLLGTAGSMAMAGKMPKKQKTGLEPVSYTKPVTTYA